MGLLSSLTGSDAAKAAKKGAKAIQQANNQNIGDFNRTFDENGNIKAFDNGLGMVPNPGVGTDANRYFTDANNMGDGIFSDGYKSYFQTPLERVIASAYGTYQLNDEQHRRRNGSAS